MDKRITPILLALFSVLAACGEDEPQVDDGFTEALPDDTILELGFVTGEGGGGGGLATIEQALEGQPSRIAEHAQTMMTRVATARAKTHDFVADLVKNGSVVNETLLGRPCRTWEKDGEENHWRLRVCGDNASGLYYFGLKGRPVAATEEADYLLVAGGHGRALPRVAMEKRGTGVIGYDFDNLKTLIGSGPSGKGAIGYRAAGAYRQLVVGLQNFQADDSAEPYSALYRYHHVIGFGGLLLVGFDADVLSVDAVSGELSETPDGVSEQGRVRIGWSTVGTARTRAIACNGSLGEGECAGLVECWDANRSVTWDNLLPNTDDPVSWSETACPGEAALPLPVEDEVPTADELTLPTGSDPEIPGPQLSEPAAVPTLEGL